MKKSTKLLGVMLAALICVFAFAMTACTPTEKEHTHTFSSEWKTDETYHYHEATCEHKSEKKDNGKHDTAGAGGACSVCGYKPTVEQHTHTFSTEWKSDETYHYHEATCEHSTEVSGKAAHDALGADGACSVCGRAPAHVHQYNEKYWAVNATIHYHAAECQHHDEKKDVGNHDTAGEGGICSVCGWKAHTDNYVYDWDTSNHWQKISCSISFKPCSKDLNELSPKYKNIAPHTFGEDGITCTICGYRNVWMYNDDCILCDECGGCVKTTCVHANDPGHKKCGDHGANTKSVILEAEHGEVYTALGDGSIADFTYGCRACIHASYSNVKFTINASKACKVTLKLRMGRQDAGDSFSKLGTIFVNGDPATTNTVMAQPKVDDNKCSLDWITFGCISLNEGVNEIDICQLDGGYMFHLDKIELLGASDVTITYDKIDNTKLYDNSGYWKPLYEDDDKDKPAADLIKA